MLFILTKLEIFLASVFIGALAGTAYKKIHKHFKKTLPKKHDRYTTSITSLTKSYLGGFHD